MSLRGLPDASWLSILLGALAAWSCSAAASPTSSSEPESRTPYVMVRTTSGTQYKVTYDSFRWRWGDLMQSTSYDLRLTKGDCVTVELQKDRTTKVEYRGRTISGCRGNSGHEFMVRHSGGTTQAWETSSPSIVSATGRDFSGNNVSVGLSSLSSVEFYR